MTIELPNDQLIPDEQLAEQWRVTRKTLWRYENEPDGLPYWIIGGRKYRGVRASAEWLARRVKKPNARRAA